MKDASRPSCAMHLAGWLVGTWNKGPRSFFVKDRVLIGDVIATVNDFVAYSQGVCKIMMALVKRVFQFSMIIQCRRPQRFWVGNDDAVDNDRASELLAAKAGFLSCRSWIVK